MVVLEEAARDLLAHPEVSVDVLEDLGVVTKVVGGAKPSGLGA